MTFSEVSNDLNAQYTLAKEGYDRFRLTEDYSAGKKYTGFNINYEQIDRDLIQAAKDEFGFNDAQVSAVYSEAYERYHSCYGDMPWGMRGLCEFAEKIMKLK